MSDCRFGVSPVNYPDPGPDMKSIFIKLTANIGMGEGCIRFWGKSAQNCGYHGNRNLPLTYNGKNPVSAFSQSPLIRSLSNR